MRRLASHPRITAMDSFRTTVGGNTGTGPERWRRFRAEDRAGYDRLLVELKTRQYGLCCYCEIRLVQTAHELQPLAYQVEHFVPKSGEPENALDPDNVLLCCTGGARRELAVPHHDPRSHPNESCGQAKRESTPTNLGLPHPSTLPIAPPIVLFTSEGRVVAAPGQVAAPPQATLDRMLNVPRLIEARRSLLDILRDEIDRTVDGDLLTITEARLAPDEGQFLHSFWSVYRQVLGAFGESWMGAHHARILQVGVAPLDVNAVS